MKFNYKLFSFFFAAMILLSCGSKHDDLEDAHADEVAHNESEITLTAEQYATAGIELGSIETKALSATIRVNGLLDLPPQSKVSITTPFSGMLKNTAMLQGKKVRKGDVVAVLQHPDYLEIQQNYLETKSQLKFQTAEYQRQQKLAEEEVNAKKSLQRAESDYQILTSKLNVLKNKLKLMHINIGQLEKGHLVNTINIYSPITGYVTEVYTNIGAMVNTSDVLFQIADTEHLHVELTVYEADVRKLKIGQKVRFTLANESKERMATVYLIGREISSERTVNVHCHLDKEDAQLLPGMYLQALVESGAERVPSLPDGAIVHYEGDRYIFFAEGDHQQKSKAYQFEMVKIKPGVSELGYTQINLDGLEEWKDKRVVLKGAYDLLSQLKNIEDEEGGHGH